MRALKIDRNPEGPGGRAARCELVAGWVKARRIMVTPPVVNPQTRLEMQRGAEKTGSPDPFDLRQPCTVWVGRELVHFETLEVFPSEQMVARIALALHAGVGQLAQDEDKSDVWPGWKD